MNYILSVQRSIDFIERNLCEPISLERVAKEAGFSQYHFHRMFLVLTGSTLADFVRRRRITAAAIALLETDEEIIQIALSYGFKSQESFTRAFKKVFEVTPGKYRKSKSPIIQKYQLYIDLKHLIKLKGGYFMNPQILKKEEFKVVGLSRNYVFKQPNEIPQLWEEFNRRESEIDNSKGNGKAYGLCIQSNAKNGEFEYVASVEVSNFMDVPEGMTAKTIPSCTYAVFTVKGVQNIPQTFQYIYGEWAGISGYEFQDSPDFEFYDNRFNPANPFESEIDIYIPIKEK